MTEEPVGRRERAVFWVAAVAIALTRLLALARSPWDWDEFDFMLALQKYDVRQHHPHPPGAPTFVLLARIAHLLVRDEFRSLQVVNMLAAALVFPAAFLFLRELRFRFADALGGGVLLAFLPNVWFFGGSGFADITGLTLLLLSLAMLLRGRQDRRAYWVGSFLLGFTAGMRPQALFAGVVPGLMASWCHRRRPVDVVVALLIGLLVMGSAYGMAAWLSGGWGPYRDVLASLNNYVRTIDSWRNPLRPPLGTLLGPFFVWPYGQPVLAWELTALAAISLVDAIVRRRWNVLLVAAVFLPIMAASWLLLDWNSRSRYGMTYGGMQAFLAVDGLALLVRRLPLPSRGQLAIQGGVVVGLVALCWSWTAPALKTARSTISPPVEALTWIKEHTSQSDELFVDQGLVPHAAYLLAHRKYELVSGEAASRPTPGMIAYFVGEGRHSERSAVEFHRARGALLEIVRKRYFDVRVSALHLIPVYIEGWDDLEEGRRESWRWMGGHGTVRLPGFPGGGELTMVFSVPAKRLPRPPLLTFRSGGQILDQFPATRGTMTRSYDLPPGREPETVDITTDQVFNPRQLGVNHDDRILGLQLFDLEWAPLGKGRPRAILLDGWYDLEGTAPLTWRWIGKTATAKLSTLDSPGVLTLDIDAPHDRQGRPVPSNLTIHAGPLVDAIRLEGRTQRTYVLPASTHPHELLIAADRSLSPAAQGASSDTRDLAVQVFTVDWRRR